MIGREEFLREFGQQALRTIRLVRLFEDKDLGLRPGEGSMSTAEQIGHICASNNFVRGLLEDETVTTELFKKPYDVSSVAAAVRSLADAMRQVQRAARVVTQQRWDETVEPFGPDWRLSRGTLAGLMIDHEVHHRGQLHVYARIAGKTPPMVYAPTDEKSLEI
jgi:uncharacterized damage-inducible protein DinB